jgi:hypothetical protein
MSEYLDKKENLMYNIVEVNIVGTRCGGLFLFGVSPSG